MRNGNRKQLFDCFHRSNGSYPTYEEWKPDGLLNPKSTPYSSYPTYEEWKPDTPAVIAPKAICSYPTYEEWKPIFSVSTIISFVLRSYPTYEEWKQYSFIAASAN